MHPEAVAMARRFAALHIAHWRAARGLPKARAASRALALSWIAAAKGRVQ